MRRKDAMVTIAVPYSILPVSIGNVFHVPVTARGNSKY